MFWKEGARKEGEGRQAEGLGLCYAQGVTDPRAGSVLLTWSVSTGPVTSLNLSCCLVTGILSCCERS